MDLNEKQIQILVVAEELFAKKGFDGTSVRQIAKEANINIAMISYYFGSKHKLLETLFIYRISGFQMQITSILSKKNSYTEKLDEIITVIVKRLHKNRHIHKIVSFEFSNVSRKLSFKNYTKLKEENFKAFTKFIKQGQEAGEFNKNVTIELLITTILGTYFHFYYNQGFFESLLQLENKTAVDQYVNNTLLTHVKQIIKSVLTCKSL
ncbi:TetR family transcriptional regulator [Tenacibaculum sp. UWU-22]|uniref:TetR family transcriptional regulator n=1 Tax=Tenacibaculum sp. UWU-22 TaxID=3234187 RepID=UPI0034DAD29B